MLSFRKKIIIGLILLVIIIIIIYLIYLNFFNDNKENNVNIKRENFEDITLPENTIDFNSGIPTITDGIGRWIVPDSVNEVKFTVVGGSGGFSFRGSRSAANGVGALVNATINVTPGDFFAFYIGQNASGGTGGRCGNNSLPYYNGGDFWNWSGKDWVRDNTAGGGGAATVVYKYIGFSRELIIVAGGGGGSGKGDLCNNHGGNASNWDGSGEDGGDCPGRKGSGFGAPKKCIAGVKGEQKNGREENGHHSGAGGGGYQPGCGAGSYSSGGGAGSSFVLASISSSFSYARNNDGLSPGVTIKYSKKITITEVIDPAFVENVRSIAIISNSVNMNLSLSYVFIYNKDGALINLKDPNNGYISSDQSNLSPNPFQSSTSPVGATPDKALSSIQRTISYAVSGSNKSSTSFLGIPLNTFNSNSSNVSHTDSTPDQKSYWIYNFKNQDPVNISAVEIFTINSNPERTSQISIKLFKSNISYNTDVSIVNMNLNNPFNLLSKATFRTLPNTPPSDDNIHGVFVIDEQYVSTNINYIDKFIEEPVTEVTNPGSVEGVYSIAIISNSAQHLNLSYVFIYGNSGERIVLTTSGLSTFQSNPFQSSTKDSGNPEKALEFNGLRTISYAVSSYNSFSTSFLGIPSNPFKWDTNNTNNSNMSCTDITPNQNSYWIYNFSSPVIVSAVEIFTINSNPERTSQISIKLFNIKIKNTDVSTVSTVSTVNTDLTNPYNLLKKATFPAINTTTNPLPYYYHRVFVINPLHVSNNPNYISSFVNQEPITYITSPKHVIGVKSIAIISNSVSINLSLSYVFIYDEEGTLIDLKDTNNGYISSDQSNLNPNPFQSSTEDNGKPDKALYSITSSTIPTNRTITHAVSIFNKSSTSFLGLTNETTNNLSNTSRTTALANKKSYWIYNFKNPVNISAVEIFTKKNSDILETSQISIKLFNNNISYNTDVVITNSNLSNRIYLLKSATFRTLPNTPPSDDNIHGVFVIDEQYVSTTNINYIDKFNTPSIATSPPRLTAPPIIRTTKPITTQYISKEPITTPYITTQPTTQEPQTTIELALEPTVPAVPTIFNCNSISDKNTCNNIDDCYYYIGTEENPISPLLLPCKNKYEYTKDFNKVDFNNVDFKCQVDQQNISSDYELKCNNYTSESSYDKFLFDSISLNQNCDLYDNQCNLLLNQSPNIKNYNDLKNHMTQFNSFNSEFNIKQKITDSQLKDIYDNNNNSIYFRDIHNNSKSINILNNPYSNIKYVERDTDIINQTTDILDQTKTNLQSLPQ